MKKISNFDFWSTFKLLSKYSIPNSIIEDLEDLKNYQVIDEQLKELNKISPDFEIVTLDLPWMQILHKKILQDSNVVFELLKQKHFYITYLIIYKGLITKETSFEGSNLLGWIDDHFKEQKIEVDYLKTLLRQRGFSKKNEACLRLNSNKSEEGKLLVDQEKNKISVGKRKTLKVPKERNLKSKKLSIENFLSNEFCPSVKKRKIDDAFSIEESNDNETEKLTTEEEIDLSCEIEKLSVRFFVEKIGNNKKQKLMTKDENNLISKIEELKIGYQSNS